MFIKNNLQMIVVNRAGLQVWLIYINLQQGMI